jgi:hypothetical protein
MVWKCHGDNVYACLAQLMQQFLAKHCRTSETTFLLKKLSVTFSCSQYIDEFERQNILMM